MVSQHPSGGIAIRRTLQTVARSQVPRPIIAGRAGPLRGDIRAREFQAFLLLWIGFTVAPILFGVDKFFNWMTYWPKYLWVASLVSSARFIPAFHVRRRSRRDRRWRDGVPAAAVRSVVAACWLGGIVTNLVIISVAGSGHSGVFWDIALRLRAAARGPCLRPAGRVYAPNPVRRRHTADS